MRSYIVSAFLLITACGSSEPSVDAPRAASAATVASASAASRPLGPRTMPKGTPEAPRVALGTHGAVSSQEAHATEVGIAILRKGGNAVDAAVAVGFALAVTHPSAGNIGGGGFMVVRMADGTKAAIDYRETAPRAASRDMYLDDKQELTNDRLVGPKAAGIPGTVAGLFMAHQKMGKLPWKDLVAPAVALARDGFAIDSVTSDDLAKSVPKMKDAKMDEAARILSRPDGTPLQTGDKLVQPDLAKALQLIADGGEKAFYSGPLAQSLADGVKKAGGIWSLQDLSSYEAVMREPIVFDYRGNQVIAMPPPSAGGVVLAQMLGASELMHLEKQPWRSVEEVHLFAEMMRRAYADRNELLGDPDFVHNPVKELTDRAYIARRMKDIDPNKATPSSQIRAGTDLGHESTQTTHFSVIDEAGDAVSNTYTLNTGYGSKFVVPGTGIILNNEMDDFATKPGTANTFGLVQGERNKIEPGKRMLSSMTPTILVKNGEVRAVIGSPGGPTISTTVAQIIRAVVDYDKPLSEAVPMFRIHHQWMPDQIITEESMPKDIEAGLVAKGHTIKRIPRIGDANCIEVDPITRGFRAVADTVRGGGEAAAY